MYSSLILNSTTQVLLYKKLFRKLLSHNRNLGCTIFGRILSSCTIFACGRERSVCLSSIFNQRCTPLTYLFFKNFNLFQQSLSKLKRRRKRLLPCVISSRARNTVPSRKSMSLSCSSTWSCVLISDKAMKLRKACTSTSSYLNKSMLPPLKTSSVIS